MACIHSSLSVGSACFQVMVVLPLCFLFLAQGHAVSSNASDEARDLLAFRDAHYSPGSLHTGSWSTWKETDPTPCAWVGVRCSPNHTVEEIDFSGWGLDLYFWEPLYELRGLRRLDLSSKNLVENPAGIGNFTALTWLDLSNTGVTQELTISGCLSMRFLSLANNCISMVPSGLSDLVNLRSLSLASNLLTGPFPAKELGDIRSLVSLDLSQNTFNGSIPALPKLTNLVDLKLDNNNFTGFEEPWLLGTKSLQQLSVSNNSLQGSIPPSITQFADLADLNMSLNKLSGNIPSGFSAQFAHGFSLDLSQNQLTSEIPTDMLATNKTNVFSSSVNLSHNLLTGNILIPQGSKLRSLAVLDLSSNNLSGPTPSNLFGDRLIRIWYLDLSNNHLSGDIVDILNGPGCRIHNRCAITEQSLHRRPFKDNE